MKRPRRMPSSGTAYKPTQGLWERLKHTICHSFAYRKAPAPVPSTSPTPLPTPLQKSHGHKNIPDPKQAQHSSNYHNPINEPGISRHVKSPGQIKKSSPSLSRRSPQHPSKKSPPPTPTSTPLTHDEYSYWRDVTATTIKISSKNLSSKQQRDKLSLGAKKVPPIAQQHLTKTPVDKDALSSEDQAYWQQFTQARHNHPQEIPQTTPSGAVTLRVKNNPKHPTATDISRNSVSPKKILSSHTPPHTPPHSPILTTHYATHHANNTDLRHAHRHSENLPPWKLWQHLSKGGFSEGVANTKLERKIKRTKEWDVRIDMHGMTRHEAIAALSHAVKKHHGKTLLVITGYGTNIIRGAIHLWLQEQTSQRNGAIIAWYTAQRHHGGSGAVYVVCRKQQSKA